MFRLISITIVYLLFVAQATAQTFDIEQDLERLDEAVAKAKTYYANKEKEIKKLKQQNATAYSKQDAYQQMRLMADLYMKYDSDSALYYASRYYELALDHHDKEQILDAELHLILVHIYRGELDHAKNILSRKGKIQDAPASCQQLMAIVSIELEGRSQLKLNKPQSPLYKKQAKRIWAKYGQYISHDNWMYYYYRCLYQGDVSIATLQQQLKGAASGTIQAAMLNYTVGLRYLQKGNKNAYIHYVIESAINDITSSNREAMSLLVLLKTPYIEQGSSRAAEYALLCTDNAKSFHDGLRSLEIVNAHSVITRQYENKLKENEKYLVMGLLLLSMTIIIIAVLTYMMYLRAQNRKLMVEDMRKMNHSLKASVESERQLQEKLKENNRKLQEEIKRRNINFIEVYRLITNYLGDIDEFKRSVYNLLATGQSDKAKEMLTSSGNLDKYLQSFYHQFDLVFLDSHPDFVQRFNALLKPEGQIRQPKPSVLTADLRIYALISMGITDSVSIATFLHYSAQTVYNYRSKIRKSAIHSDFAEQIAHLYT